MNLPQNDNPTPRVRNMRQLWEQFDEYVAEVNASALADTSKKDYIIFAEQFVRWIEGYFTPGANVK